MESVASTAASTRPARRARGRGLHPKGSDRRQNSREFCRLPEYLEATEAEALIEHAPNALCKLLLLIQWRAGLRISEALSLEARDVQLETDRPTLRVRRGKGRKARIVPVHPALAAEINARLDYGDRKTKDARLIGVGRQWASKWVAEAVKRAVEAGVLEPERRVTSHTLRHSYARHLLANGVALNVLSRWLGHSSIETTLVYVELLPDPAGTMAGIP